jgi:imidazoleglycerol-phosphate dehydratase
MREAEVVRKTNETDIRMAVRLDGSGKCTIRTPIGMLSHLLEAFCKHGLFDIEIEANGDLEVDQHHLVEDCGRVLGESFIMALGEKKGINRTGFFVFPMDEALAVVSVDMGGRPVLQFEAAFRRRYCGRLDTDLVEDFFTAFSQGALANTVVRMPYGRSDHHKLEAIFKAFGKAVKMACEMNAGSWDSVPSTKGVI